MRTILLTVVVGFALGIPLASAQAAEDVEKLSGYLSSNRVVEAWALAEKIEPQHAGEPEFDLLYAQAALAAKHPSQAIFALERIRQQQPGQQQARLLLVRAHRAADDSIRARSELDALLASKPSEPVRSEAQKLANQLIAPAMSRPVRGFIGLDVGYDSNVNSATEANVIKGIGGSAIAGVVLAPGDRAQQDTLMRLSAGYGGQYPLSSQLSLFADASGYANVLYDQTQFTSSLYQARTGASWQVGPHRLAFPISRQVFNLDHRRYSTYDAVALEWTYTLSAAQRLFMAASRGMASYIDQSTRDVRINTVLLEWSAIIGRARFGVNARAGQDDPRIGFNEALLQSNAFVGRRSYALGIDTRYRLWPGHTPRLSVSVQSSRYADSDPVFGVRRQDQYAFVVAGWDWQVRPDWVVRADLNYATNHSNMDLYEFDKYQVLLGARHDFH